MNDYILYPRQIQDNQSNILLDNKWTFNNDDNTGDYFINNENSKSIPDLVDTEKFPFLLSNNKDTGYIFFFTGTGDNYNKNYNSFYDNTSLFPLGYFDVQNFLTSYFRFAYYDSDDSSNQLLIDEKIIPTTKLQKSEIAGKITYHPVIVNYKEFNRKALNYLSIINIPTYFFNKTKNNKIYLKITFHNSKNGRVYKFIPTSINYSFYSLDNSSEVATDFDFYYTKKINSSIAAVNYFESREFLALDVDWNNKSFALPAEFIFGNNTEKNFLFFNNLFLVA